VPIYFKSQADYEAFFFCDLNGFNDQVKIQLPEEILLKDFLLLIQGSLDQIKPVILFNDSSFETEINLAELKSHHHKFEKNKFIFLNYSIRNSLSNFTFSEEKVISFDEIYQSIQKILQK